MKKHLSIVFVMLVVMAIFTSTAFAAPAANASISLKSVTFNGSGVVLKFSTSGLTKKDLNDNFFKIASNSYNMECSFIDETTDVRCLVSKDLSSLAGESFIAGLHGFLFYGNVPQAACVPWINIDVFEDGELLGSFDATLAEWDYVASQGLFEYWAAYGITYKITGNYCDSFDYNINYYS